MQPYINKSKGSVCAPVRLCIQRARLALVVLGARARELVPEESFFMIEIFLVGNREV